MRLSDFDYPLPKELIAQYPSAERGQDRLLVLNRSDGSIFHRRFVDFTDYFSRGDALIMNDAKVVKVRLIGKKSDNGRSVEILLLHRVAGGEFRALLKPLSKLKIGDEIVFDKGNLTARVTAKDRVVFNSDDEKSIYMYGYLPLPPYIKRLPQAIDEDRYQTVFASREGAIASPTAGLHFDRKILKKIRDMGVAIGFLTLQVGYGTFKPVRHEEISQHSMEEEYFYVSRKIKFLISNTRERGGRVFAVGTTTVRALESAFRCDTAECSGFTDLFIYPGFEFKSVDCLLTNFHLPRSTLLMLVAAYAGRDLIMKAYMEAIKRKYRFCSYGDAMLII